MKKEHIILLVALAIDCIPYLIMLFL